MEDDSVDASLLIGFVLLSEDDLLQAEGLVRVADRVLQPIIFTFSGDLCDVEESGLQ